MQLVEREIVVGKRLPEIASLQRRVALVDERLGLAIVGLQYLAGFKVDYVRKCLDRNVEDAREHSQLVERWITDSLFVTGKLGVVDLTTLGLRALFDTTKRVAVADSQSTKVAAQSNAALEGTLSVSFHGYVPPRL